MRLIEKVEAADEETQVDFLAAMDAAMTGRSKKEILEDYRRAKKEAEENFDGDEDLDAEDGDVQNEGDGAGSQKRKATRNPRRLRGGARAPVQGLGRVTRGGRDRRDLGWMCWC